MINRIANRLEQTCGRLRKFGKEIFDIQELEAKGYHRKVGRDDIFTILDKDYNQLLVETVKAKSTREKEAVTQFFLPNGREIVIKSTMKKCN